MNKLRKLKALMATLLLVVPFTGCQLIEQDFNASGYIEAVLNSTYKQESQEYIGLTGANATQAESNHQTTVSNAVSRFFTKYQANPSQEQVTALGQILSAAYKQASYSVAEKQTITDGYTVEVSFSPIINLVNSTTQLNRIQSGAGDEAYDLGATYIDDMIALCKTALTTPTFGAAQSVVFQLRVAENGEVSINIHQFDQIDDAIFPL